MNESQSAWRDILEVAIQAPSPHNVQPWKIEILSDTEVRVYIVKRRMLPKEDVTGSFILSGMMLFLEAIAIVSQNQGFTLDYSLLDRNEALELIPFADLKIHKSTEATERYSNELFLKRRTSRLSYEHKVIPAEIHAKLAALAEEFGQRYSYTDDPAQIEEIVHMNIKALFHDLNEASYHDEIVSWFRFSRAQSQQELDGLDYQCMNVPPLEYWLSAKLPGMLKIPGLSTLIHRRYRRILGNVPTFGYISGPFWEPDQALMAGRFLMRFWLELTKYDLYIHPFGNLITNKPARTWLERNLECSNLWFVFRIGYSAEPPKSHRRLLNDVLIKDRS